MTTRRVTDVEAGATFEALLTSVERDGDTIIITRDGKPIARLVGIPSGAGDGDWLDGVAFAMGGEPVRRAELYGRGERPFGRRDAGDEFE